MLDTWKRCPGAASSKNICITEPTRWDAPNRGIQRTRLPPFHYPPTHSGPLIPGVRRPYLSGSETTHQAMMRKPVQVVIARTMRLLASHSPFPDTTVPLSLISSPLPDTRSSRNCLSASLNTAAAFQGCLRRAIGRAKLKDKDDLGTSSCFSNKSKKNCLRK